MADTTTGSSRPDPDDVAPEFGEPAPLSLWARLAWITGAALLVVAAFYFMAHAAFPRINPAQPAPSGHYPGTCAACHTVTADVPVRAKK
jgi:hypothetical protein